jgi:hypothetical protein
MRALASLVLLASPALAQQFTASNLPGPIVWSDAVAFLDVEGDGDLDVALATGDGYSNAGPARQQLLLVNDGAANFTDESVARLGTLLLIAKMVIAVDVDGDGDDDLVYAQISTPGASTRKPVLMLNNGSGTFTNVSAAQLPAPFMSSFCVAAGDVDDDGDSDLAINDGASFVGTNGQARLFLNDGLGFYSDATATHLPVNLYNSQDVTLVDANNDWAIDIVQSGKTAGSRLWLNDGTGHFTVSSALAAAATGATYETDWADLDADGDVDGSIQSISGFSEGWARNNLLPSGTLTFTNLLFAGTNGDDDNEMAQLDVDNDGDLDVFVARIGGSDKAYTQNPAGTFTFAAGVIQSVFDTSLDLGFADLNGDARYDMVTAQGESGTFQQRKYLNGGAMDTVPPAFLRVQMPAAFRASGPFRYKAFVQDAIVDDGTTNASLTFDYTIAGTAGNASASGVDAFHMGGGTFRAGLPVPAGIGLAGGTVSLTWHASDPPGNLSSSGPIVVNVCGFEAYGTGLGGANTLAIAGSPDPKIGAIVSITVSGAPGGAAGGIGFALGPGAFPFLGGTLLLDPFTVVEIPAVTDPSGQASLVAAIPNDPVLVLGAVYFQGGFIDLSVPGFVALSHGLKAVVCPAVF